MMNQNWGNLSRQNLQPHNFQNQKPPGRDPLLSRKSVQGINKAALKLNKTDVMVLRDAGLPKAQGVSYAGQKHPSNSGLTLLQQQQLNLQQQQVQRSHSDSSYGRKRVISSNSQKRLTPQPASHNAGGQEGGRGSYQTAHHSNTIQSVQSALQFKSYSDVHQHQTTSTKTLPMKQPSGPTSQQQRPSQSVNNLHPLHSKVMPTSSPQKTSGLTKYHPSQQRQNHNKVMMKPVFQRAYQQFLNVDPKTNQILLELIKPMASDFDFNSYSKFVVNASELSNQELFDELYSVAPHNDRQSSVERAKAENLKFSHNSTKPARSRNAMNTLTAGQSINTLSFFDPRQENHSAACDFFHQLKTELRDQTFDNIQQLMSDFQAAKFSSKRNGLVAGYGANTNQGISRNYNEDRVAIILNIMKPKQKVFNGTAWPKCSFFGVYDGHGGNVCADFLRDYLHQLIIKDDQFPGNPIQAIRNAFTEAEKLYIEFALGQQSETGDIERSGSCAIIVLVVNDICYVANTGDSRAVMSVNGGKQVVTLSNDHKPTDDIETDRIMANGGQIYQNASVINQQGQTQVVLGPHRVFPGRLSVCRTFGDIEAKAAHLLGNPKVVIADPDICQFKIDSNKHDFLLLGCDGIFDKLEDRDCVHTVWQHVINQTNFDKSQELFQASSVDEERYSHELCGNAVDAVLKTTAIRRSADNITVVFVAFDNFFELVRQSRGDISSFEPSKIELQMIDLQQPPDPNHPTSASRHSHNTTQKTDIFIGDLPPSQISITSTDNDPLQAQGNNFQAIVGDTGDHNFSKEFLLQQQNKEEHLSDISEEADAASMISERMLFKQRQQQQQAQIQAAARPTSSSGRPQNALSGEVIPKKRLLNSSQLLEPIKSTVKPGAQPAPQQQLQKQYPISQARSLPKYLPHSSEAHLSQTMTTVYSSHGNQLQQQLQPPRQPIPKASPQITNSNRVFYTEQTEVSTNQQQHPPSITIMKPASARRRKVFVKTGGILNSQNSSSQFLAQVKQSTMPIQSGKHTGLQQYSGGQQTQGGAKSRNSQLQSNLVPKAWSSVNYGSEKVQNNLMASAQTFQQGEPVKTFDSRKPR